MTKIQSFPFEKDKFFQLKEYHFGRNWPVVYLSENGKEMYIGETTSAYVRSKQHYENPDRRRLKTIHILTDEEFNKSAALDIEAWLIQYMAADGRFILQNGNGGLQNHNYFDREKYRAKFEIAWSALQKMGLARHSLHHLKNTDLFKYSPYKTLSDDQRLVADQIVDDILNGRASTIVVNGRPGTGKTILATYLFKLLKEKEETKDWNMGLVVPMTSLRDTIKKVFRNIKGLNGSMVLGPADVVKKKYDLLLVDEAHRLHRRVGLTNYGSYDNVNRSLNFDREATELNWIKASSAFQILFYDEQQSVRTSDIRHSDIHKLQAKHYELLMQMRVEGGGEYLKFIDDIFDISKNPQYKFSNYDFRIFDDVDEMISLVKEKDKEHGLSRLVAGYAWPWNTKDKANRKLDYDIEINGTRLIWNSTNQDWVNSENAINEVGCIHTVQGYDLNYVGVIIGPELTYDTDAKSIKVDKLRYFDTKGRAGVLDAAELERYIINIYKTLMTRGIYGTYLYIVDENLRAYLNERLHG